MITLLVYYESSNYILIIYKKVGKGKKKENAYKDDVLANFHILEEYGEWTKRY